MVLEASIGRYRIDQLVKRGGSSEVWKAYDEALGRPVALKLLYNEVGKSVDRERFAREARAAARLSHPHIVATYDVGEWDERPYLVMEFLDGRTVVDDLTEREKLPVEMVRSIGVQVADGLEYVHASGVIHRDIKPDNLVWTEDGVLKLVDFGVAWLIDETGPRLTPNGMAMGTFAYLAPETAKGELFDQRSDLYSLGCVLYELLCGVPPFVGPMPTVVLAHVQSEPIPPTAIREDIPLGLERLILDLLAKEPKHRPADAGVVRKRLLDTSWGVPGGKIPSPRRRPALGPGRKRRALAVTAGLAVAGAAGSVAWWVLPGQDRGGAVADVEPHPLVTQKDAEEPTGRSSTEVDARLSEERGEKRVVKPADSTDPRQRTEGTLPGQPSGSERDGLDGSRTTTGAESDGSGTEDSGGSDGTSTGGTGTDESTLEDTTPPASGGEEPEDDESENEPADDGSDAGAGDEDGDGVPDIAEESSAGAATNGKANGKGNGNGEGKD